MKYMKANQEKLMEESQKKSMKKILEDLPGKLTEYFAKALRDKSIPLLFF